VPADTADPVKDNDWMLFELKLLQLGAPSTV
jgi:hypothetical protein